MSILNKHFFEIMNMVKYFRNTYYNSQASQYQENKAGDNSEKIIPVIADTNTTAPDMELVGLNEETEFGDKQINRQMLVTRDVTDLDKINSISDKILEIQETMNTFAAHVFEQEMKTSES